MDISSRNKTPEMIPPPSQQNNNKAKKGALFHDESDISI
jgi:hypothetical protein